MTFEEWWESQTHESKYETRTQWDGYRAAESAWQAAQQAERERTIGIMLKHLAQWNVPWSESVDKAVNEINELDT